MKVEVHVAGWRVLHTAPGDASTGGFTYHIQRPAIVPSSPSPLCFFSLRFCVQGSYNTGDVFSLFSIYIFLPKHVSNYELYTRKKVSELKMIFPDMGK